MSELTYKQPHIATQIDKATQNTTMHTETYMMHHSSNSSWVACDYKSKSIAIMRICSTIFHISYEAMT